MRVRTRSHLSRREFLKLSGLGILGAALPFKPLSVYQGLHFGRVIGDSVQVYDIPSFTGKEVRQYWRDDVLPIHETVIADPPPAYNQAWYRIDEGGFVHSSLLQPVKILINTPQEDLPENGVLTDVSVPYTDAYHGPSIHEPIAYRYYYGSTHWIDRLIVDADKRFWYRVMDDRIKGRFYYVSAYHLHIIPPQWLSPISEDLPWDDKRIEVYLTEQMMIAYEGAKAVLVAQVSTGDEATNPRWRTPLGSFQIYYKRPSRHMHSPSPEYGDYDLPGVPWVCFFTEQGHAFHGVYWHNEFGLRRSHGCINLSLQDANWLYRWTTPAVPPERHTYFNTKYGTRLTIFK
jgi:hypothetical protein